MQNEILSESQTDKFLTRRELAKRWRCSGESVKRRQRAGLLRPFYLSERKLLYSLAEIEALEAAGGGAQ
jgi:hypothetical protein